MDDLIKSRIQKEILIAEKKKINKKKRSFEFKELNFESFESFPLRGEVGVLVGIILIINPKKITPLTVREQREPRNISGRNGRGTSVYHNLWGWSRRDRVSMMGTRSPIQRACSLKR